jgi:hypothetical protein
LERISCLIDGINFAAQFSSGFSHLTYLLSFSDNLHFFTQKLGLFDKIRTRCPIYDFQSIGPKKHRQKASKADHFINGFIGKDDNGSK